MLEEELHIALLVEQRETKDLGPCPGFVGMARVLEGLETLYLPPGQLSHWALCDLRQVFCVSVFLSIM